MKIKLIYKDDTDKYFIRYSNGKSKIVKLNDAYHLSQELGIGIGDSENVESRNIILDWTDGTPPPIPIKLKGHLTREIMLGNTRKNIIKEIKKEFLCIINKDSRKRNGLTKL